MAQALTTLCPAARTLAAEPAARRTRALLACGMAAGPVFIGMVLFQARIRDGFDLTRHAASLLTAGPPGWIQITTFAVTGLLSIACAAGMRHVLGHRSGGTRLVGIFGTGLLVAGAFRADPADGFPPGAPPGPGQVSWHGVLHMVGFGVGFVCLIAACFVVARALAALGRPKLAVYSRSSGFVVLAGIAGSFATTGSATALAFIWLAVVTAWSWLAVVAARLRSEPGVRPSG